MKTVLAFDENWFFRGNFIVILERSPLLFSRFNSSVISLVIACISYRIVEVINPDCFLNANQLFYEKANEFYEVIGMRNTEIKFEISENLLSSLNQNKREFTNQLRLFSALHLFKNHKLSFGQASELAGMKREHFLVELEKHGIDFIDYDPLELEGELERFKA